MKSCENKSNLHHCSTELSNAFHLPLSQKKKKNPTPSSLPANSPHHATALRWKTGFKGSGKEDIYITSTHYLVILILSLFSLPEDLHLHPFSFLCPRLPPITPHYSSNFSQASFSCIFSVFSSLSFPPLLHFIYTSTTLYLFPL